MNRTPLQRAEYRRRNGAKVRPYVPHAIRSAMSAALKMSRAAQATFERHLKRRPQPGSRIWYCSASAEEIDAYRAEQSAKARKIYANDPARGVAKSRAFKLANPEMVKRHGALRQQRIRETSDGSVTDAAVAALLAAARRCRYCRVLLSRDGKTSDHFIPLARGGRHIIGNIVVACSPCNTSKGAKMPDAFIAALREAGKLHA